jgi:hypothetical protein
MSFLLFLIALVIEAMILLKGQNENYKASNIDSEKAEVAVDRNQHGLRRWNPGECEINLNKRLIKISINSFRTSVYLLTCVTILGVDFDVFPEEHAKTHTFGYGLMDLGVGFFIMCHSMKFLINRSQEDNFNERQMSNRSTSFLQ